MQEWGERIFSNRNREWESTSG